MPKPPLQCIVKGRLGVLESYSVLAISVPDYSGPGTTGPFCAVFDLVRLGLVHGAGPGPFGSSGSSEAP